MATVTVKTEDVDITIHESGNSKELYNVSMAIAKLIRSYEVTTDKRLWDEIEEDLIELRRDNP